MQGCEVLHENRAASNRRTVMEWCMANTVDRSQPQDAFWREELRSLRKEVEPTRGGACGSESRGSELRAPDPVNSREQQLCTLILHFF